MDKNIAKSPEMIAKEAKIEALKKQLKKRKSVLKSLKTRLKNTQKSIEDIQRDIQSKMFSKMMELDDIRMEVGRLAEKLKSNKHFSKKDREALDEMAREFLGEDIFGEGFSDFREQRQQMEDGEFEFEFGDEERAKMHDMFQEFQVKPSEKEQRDIRKVFLKLSKTFHPDLARTEKEKEQYHVLMQEINAAYKSNDIQTLLEMEQMYLIEDLNYTTKAVSIDMLQQEIERLERDVAFINSQVERTSNEVKNLRKSDMGTMLTQMDKAEREGEGFSAMEAELQEAIDMMKQMREGLKDSDERGTVSPILMQMMNPFAGLMGDMGEDMFGDMPEIQEEQIADVAQMLGKMMGMDESDVSSMLGGMFGSEKDELENQKFPNGTGVRVKKKVRHEEDRMVNMKGWTAAVREAYDGGRNKIVYIVDFDIKTLNEKMPDDLISEMVEEELDFQEHEFAEHQLEAFELEDTEEERYAIFRKLHFKARWEDLLEENQLKTFEAILLHDPTVGEEENWEIYLKNNLKFPFDAKVLGRLDRRKGSKVKVIGISHLDNRGRGQVMKIKVGRSRQTQYYPLIDLAPIKEGNNLEVMGNYHLWGSEELPFNMNIFGF